MIAIVNLPRVLGTTKITFEGTINKSLSRSPTEALDDKLSGRGKQGVVNKADMTLNVIEDILYSLLYADIN